MRLQKTQLKSCGYVGRSSAAGREDLKDLKDDEIFAERLVLDLKKKRCIGGAPAFDFEMVLRPRDSFHAARSFFGGAASPLSPHTGNVS